MLPSSLFSTFIAFVTLLVVSCSPGSRIASKQPIEASASLDSALFQEATTTALNAPWREGNHIETLVNGDAFYPAMIKAIKAAKKSITFETFAFVEGYAARDLINALAERAKAGVKVHVVLDHTGSNTMGKFNIATMRNAGIDLHFYHPLSIFHPIESNIRDHRKIMVVDGKVGFTGGCGVGDAWLGNARSEEEWRETHYRVTGPIVADLQRGFNINWVKTGGAPLRGSNYFPLLSKTGKLIAQAFDSAPQDKIFTIPHLYRQAFASAKKSIIIENSYVVLDRVMMDALLAARARGVHVEMIMPSDHCDSWAVRFLSVFQYPKLLEAGVHIYEYQTSMMHCKVMVIDELFTTIGSANIDPRSLYINDESNVNVLDAGFAKEQLRIIENDKRQSKRILTARHPWHPIDLPMRALLGLSKSQM
ncbi:MAG: phospholipase D-like domain-containing protein [Akkermansiaceae bacterium]